MIADTILDSVQNPAYSLLRLANQPKFPSRNQRISRKWLTSCNNFLGNAWFTYGLSSHFVIYFMLV